MPRHRPVRSMPTVVCTTAVAVVLTAVGGATAHWAMPDASHDVAPTPTASVRVQLTPFREFATQYGAPGHPVTVEHVGTVSAITDTSLTAVSSDGTIRTYVVTPLTTAVTVRANQYGSASSQFSVNDLVSIVATVEDGTLIASVLVDQAFANGDGPPMDGYQ